MFLLVEIGLNDLINLGVPWYPRHPQGQHPWCSRLLLFPPPQMLRSMTTGRSENLRGQAVIDSRFIEQELLLFLSKSEGIITPPPLTASSDGPEIISGKRPYSFRPAYYDNIWVQLIYNCSPRLQKHCKLVSRDIQMNTLQRPSFNYSLSKNE